MSVIRHKLGEALVVFATQPIQRYDVATGQTVPVANAQGEGYVPSATLRSRSAEGPVLGTFALTWPSPSLWMLQLPTGALPPGLAVFDLRVAMPDGAIVFSETHAIELQRAETR